jgi:type IV secretory pathway VirB2 component (pilin)
MQSTRASAKTAVLAPAQLYKLALISFLAIAIYTTVITAAYATFVVSPMGTVLCFIVSIIYGNLGRAIATLAIIMIGIGAMLGKASWGMAITVLVGIAIVFNASAIVFAITGASC